MFYKSLLIKGFGPYYKKKEFSFNGGLNIITGSNGSGKTTIFDALQWCLYGPKGSDRTLKDRSSIINDRAQSAHIELSFYADDGSDVLLSRTLTRSGKHTVVLYIDDVKQEANITETQKILEELLGNIHHDVYSSISMMMSSPTHSINKFISGSPLDRRKVLSAIVDPTEIWSESHKVFKKRTTQEKKKVQALGNKIEVLQGIIDNIVPVEKPEEDITVIKQEIKKLYENKSLSNNNDYNQVRYLEVQLDIFKSNLEDIIVEIEEYSDDKYNVLETIVELKKEKQELENKKKEFFKDKEKRVQQKDSFEFSINFFNDQVEYLNRDRTRLLSVLSRENTLNDLLSQSKDKCAVCGTELDIDISKNNHHKQEILKLEKKDDEYKKEIQEYNNKKKFIEKYYKELLNDKNDNINWDDEIQNILNKIDKNVKEQIKIEEIINKLQEEKKNVKKEISNIEKKLSHVEKDEISDEEDIDNKIRKAEKHLLRIEAQEENYDDYVKDIEAKNKELEDLQEELEWKNKVLNTLNNLVDCSSPTGYISSDIDNFCQEVNNEVNNIYEEVFNKNPHISVESASDDLEPTCMIYSNNRNIETYSHGEQSRMIMAILCSLTSILFNRTGVWLPPLWDEPTLSIDNKDHYSVIDILSKLSVDEFNQYFVITRDNGIIKDYQEDSLLEL